MTGAAEVSFTIDVLQRGDGVLVQAGVEATGSSGQKAESVLLEPTEIAGSGIVGVIADLLVGMDALLCPLMEGSDRQHPAVVGTLAEVLEREAASAPAGTVQDRA